MDPEAKAIDKMLAGPAPFSTPRYATIVRVMRAQASELQADDPTRTKLLADADEREKVLLEGEIWPLTHREHWRIKALLTQANEVAEDLTPGARQRFVESMVSELRAQAIFRVPGTNGKVHVLTHEEAAQADPAAIMAINLAWIERFALTEDEVPKAPTPR